MAKARKRGGSIYTKTLGGKIGVIGVVCETENGAGGNRLTQLEILPTLHSQAYIGVVMSGEGRYVTVPRKRLFTLARLLKAMAKQLPKEE